MEWISGIWEWLARFWESLTWGGIVFGSIAILLSAALSYAAIIFVMIKLPADYFSPHYSSAFAKNQSFLVRWGMVIFKNFIGLLLILAGIAMILGPGPGLLTILLGLIMMDIPGKRPLEANIIKRPAVLSAVNNLRAKYNKPPLVVD
jgi:hypothetical protein